MNLKWHRSLNSEHRRTDERLLAKVARMYYEHGLSQQEIADRLRTSRPTISRLLEQARESGVVEIFIRTEHERCSRLEDELERLFSLKEAAVVAVDAGDDARVKKALGRVAAGILRRIVRQSDVIGVSWGTTLREMVNALAPQRVPGVMVVAIVGGVGQARIDVHANSLVVDMAEVFGGTWRVLHAPAIVAGRELRDAILRDPNILGVMNLARRADIAVVGVGALVESSTMIETGYLTTRDVEALKAHGAVGDVCSFFYDIEGRLCDVEVNRRVVGVEPEALKEMDSVIGVAGGPRKHESVLGALRGGFVNILVTDEGTAEHVLALEKARKGKA